MNGIDYSILTLVGFFLLFGILRGFIREAISIATWILALSVAVYFSPLLADKAVKYIHTPELRLELSFVGLWLVVLLLGAWFNATVGKAMSPEGVSLINRLAGAVLGGIRGVFITGLLLLIGTTESVHLNTSSAWQEAKLIPYFSRVSDTLLTIYNEQLMRYTTGIANTLKSN